MQELIGDLIRDEGNISVVYDDATGKPLRPGDTLHGWPTIGPGINLCEPLDEEERRYLLIRRIARVERDLDRALPWWRGLSERRQRALANAAYNLGLPRLLGFRKALDALEDGDFETAAREFLDSKWAAQVGERAERIAKMIRGG